MYSHQPDAEVIFFTDDVVLYLGSTVGYSRIFATPMIAYDDGIVFARVYLSIYLPVRIRTCLPAETN
jgi:hypothetical protein